MIDHGTILDDDSVLTALQMDRHFFNWGHHDTYFDSLVSLDNGKHSLDLLWVGFFWDYFFSSYFWSLCKKRRAHCCVCCIRLVGQGWGRRAVSPSQLIYCEKALGLRHNQPNQIQLDSVLIRCLDLCCSTACSLLSNDKPWPCCNVCSHHGMQAQCMFSNT